MHCLADIPEYSFSLRSFRDSSTNVVRMLVSGVLAAAVAAMYGKQADGMTKDSVSNRINIIAQAVINVSMVSSLPPVLAAVKG